MRLWFLGLLLCVQLGRAPARSPRTADQVSEADIQRLLHGVMEQLGIARPRVEYPAHQATNIVGPQSIQGTFDGFKGERHRMRLIHRVLHVRSSCFCSGPFDVRCLRRFSALCGEMPEMYRHLNSIQNRNQCRCSDRKNTQNSKSAGTYRLCSAVDLMYWW